MNQVNSSAQHLKNSKSKVPSDTVARVEPNYSEMSQWYVMFYSIISFSLIKLLHSCGVSLLANQHSRNSNKNLGRPSRIRIKYNASHKAAHHFVEGIFKNLQQCTCWKPKALTTLLAPRNNESGRALAPVTWTATYPQPKNPALVKESKKTKL